MADYKKLVEALRCCAGVHTKPTKCPDYDDSWCGGDCLDNHLITAAAAIEELQAELAGSKDAIRILKHNLEMKLPKRGEWVEENRRPRSSQFVCSECHRTAYDPQPTRDKAWRKRCRYAYCPNCGAKMEAQDDKA